MPAKWIKKYGVRKGDELEVSELGNKLLISTSKTQNPSFASINLRGLGKNLIRRIILSLYTYGYDEIRLNVDDIIPIQNAISNCLGYAVIEQTENSCIIKDLSGTTDIEFDVIFKRAFRLIITTAKECARLAELKKSLDQIERGDPSINQFTDYCLRYLNKKGYGDAISTNIYYVLMHNLERIGDFYKHISSWSAKNKLVKDNIEMLKLAANKLDGLHELASNFDAVAAKKYYDGCIDILSQQYTKNEVTYYLTEIIKVCSSFVPNLLTANINKLQLS
jgi:phosphate uptake regulator